MGAFLLHHRSIRIDEEQLKRVYNSKGFNSMHIADIGDYRLFLYRKQLINTDNFYFDGQNAVYACGSVFYNGSGYSTTLCSLLPDFLAGNLKLSLIRGNYVLIFFRKDDSSITLFTDRHVIRSIYFHRDEKILTTDFLSLMAIKGLPYSLNRMAIIENMTTGNLIPPDTYVNEIRRVDKVNFSELAIHFPGINFATSGTIAECHFTGRKDALRDANGRLSEYFGSAREITQQFGAHIGLTGGLDSRLLLAHARKHLDKLITNSFWRPDSRDFIFARLLAEKAGTRFVSLVNGGFEETKEVEIIKSSYFFFDGQIRSQNNWKEEFSLPEYAKFIASSHYIGFHGCGGEQYRNFEKICGKIRLSDFVIYDWLFKQCDNVFINKRLQEDVIRAITAKIKRLTGISDKRIGLDQVKRIQNEVWIISNRTTRLNALNQLMFYFAPFTESQMSHAAYGYTPFLGCSSAFETAMISEADRDLASVNTNYGYQPLKGEPVSSRIVSLIAGIVPRHFFHWVNGVIRKRRSLTSNSNGAISGLNPFMSAIGSEIDLEKLRGNKNLGWCVAAFNELTDRLVNTNEATANEL